MTRARTLFIVIDNLGDIAAFFGEGIAARVLSECGRRLERWPDAGLRVDEIGDWGVTVSAASSGDDERDRLRVDAMLHAASSSPMDVGGVSIVVALSRSDIRPRQNHVLRMSGHSSSLDYRGDMRAAALAYRALSVPRIRFAEQIVCGSHEGGELLYTECLTRLRDDRGGPLMPGDYVPALERLGLTRGFDRQIVTTVVERLLRDPDRVLGCNISVLSASADLWWKSVFPRLLASPGVAQRLVIEVTESARPRSLEDAVKFVGHLRSMGCRVALDDFGAGFSSIGFAREARFDFIKIDGSYIRRRANGEDPASLLGHLVVLAKELAGDVIVEGIETESDCDMACAAGAEWLQGYLFGWSRPPEETGPATGAIIRLAERRDRSAMGLFP